MIPVALSHQVRRQLLPSHHWLIQRTTGGLGGRGSLGLPQEGLNPILLSPASDILVTLSSSTRIIC